MKVYNRETDTRVGPAPQHINYKVPGAGQVDNSVLIARPSSQSVIVITLLHKAPGPPKASEPKSSSLAKGYARIVDWCTWRGPDSEYDRVRSLLTLTAPKFNVQASRSMTRCVDFKISISERSALSDAGQVHHAAAART